MQIVPVRPQTLFTQQHEEEGERGEEMPKGMDARSADEGKEAAVEARGISEEALQKEGKEARQP